MINLNPVDIINRLKSGNLSYIVSCDVEKRIDTALNGQAPDAIVICCSDSRVIPEKIFSVTIGELFVIRVAGNVLDNHQLGSIEYAAAHLGCKLIIMLGHTGCGAVTAALSGHSDGFISYITEDIIKAVGDERDPYKACVLNVEYGVRRIKTEFAAHSEISDAEVVGAVYNFTTGRVEWL